MPICFLLGASEQPGGSWCFSKPRFQDEETEAQRAARMSMQPAVKLDSSQVHLALSVCNLCPQVWVCVCRGPGCASYFQWGLLKPSSLISWTTTRGCVHSVPCFSDVLGGSCWTTPHRSWIHSLLFTFVEPLLSVRPLGRKNEARRSPWAQV